MGPGGGSRVESRVSTWCKEDQRDDGRTGMLDTYNDGLIHFELFVCVWVWVQSAKVCVKVGWFVV